MAKIKKLHPWYLIKLRSSNKDKNSENDEISVTDFTSQLTDTIVDDVTIKKDPATGEIFVSPDLSVDHSKATNVDLEGSHPATAICSDDKTILSGSVEEQLQTVNDDAVFRDANGNAEINNLIEGIDLTPTSATPIVFTVATPYNQYFSGSLAQTITMPIVSTLKIGMAWMINNKSSQIVTVNSSGGNLIVSIPGGMASIIMCVSLSGTTASSWDTININNDMTSGGHLIYNSIVPTYSALPPASDNPNKLFYVSTTQGTKWLPGNLGGTYYPQGWYYSDGIIYTWQEIPFQATQIEVNTGTNVDKFITPKTFNDSTQLASKEDRDITGYTSDTPLDSDLFSFWDIVDSLRKKITWSNLKSTLKTHFDTIYLTIQFAVDDNKFGFKNQTDTTITFDGTNTFTLAPTSGSYDYYRAGSKDHITAAKTVVMTLTDGNKYFVYIDSDDATLNYSTTAWTLSNTDTKVTVACLAWNSTLTPKYIFQEERHNWQFPRASHEYIHKTIGTKVQTIGAITGYTLNSDINANKTFAIAQSSIWDEGINLIIPALTKPNGTNTDYFIAYRNSPSTWLWKKSNMPFVYNVGNSNNWIQWDNNGTMTDATGGAGGKTRWLNSYLFVNNAKNDNAWNAIIPGRAIFSSLAGAISEDPSTFDLTGIPFLEGVTVYQITWSTITSTSQGKCVMASAPKRVQVSLANSINTVNTVSEGNVTMSERTILSGTNLGANADIIASILGGGTVGQVLKSIGNGTTPTWQDESGGGGADSRKSRVAYNTIMNSNY